MTYPVPTKAPSRQLAITMRVCGGLDFLSCHRTIDNLEQRSFTRLIQASSFVLTGNEIKEYFVIFDLTLLPNVFKSEFRNLPGWRVEESFCSFYNCCYNPVISV
jgi:hypothetical protein